MKMNFIFKCLIIFAVIYFAFCALVFFFQRKLIYIPSKDLSNYHILESLGMKEIWINSGAKINAWFFLTKSQSEIILYLHGNGGNVSHRAHKFAEIINRGYGLLAIDYRGYGKSSGSPTEWGLYEDAVAALNWLHDKNYNNQQIIIYGESIGTAVAIEVSQERNFNKIILESPLSSLVDVGKEIYPFLPVSFLLKDRYDSLAKLDKVNSPIFIFHGAEDSIIPEQQSYKLYQNIQNVRKFRKVFTGKNHNDLNIGKIISLIDQ